MPRCELSFRRSKLSRSGVEISYSQNRKDFADVVENYIIGTSSNIATVIGFDLEYKKTKHVSVLCWRPATEVENDEEIGICKQVMDEV